MDQQLPSTNETSIKRLEDRVLELERSFSLIGSDLRELTAIMKLKEGHDERLRNVELDMANTKPVINAAKWLAVTVAGSTLTITVSALYGAFV